MSQPQLVEFDSEWISQYREVVNSYKTFGINGITAIYHIGGTSVRMKARPVIDILMVFQSNSDLNRGVSLLSNHGYIPSEDKPITGLFFLRHQPENTKLEINLYIFENGNPHIARLLLFRNLLRSRSDLVEEYERVRGPGSTPNQKNNFIKRMDRISMDGHEGALPHSEPTPEQLIIDMTSQDIMKRLADNLFFEMTYHAYFAESSDLYTIGPVTAVSTGVPSELYNYLLSPTPRLRNKSAADGREEVIRGAIDPLHENKLPFAIWAGPNSITEIRDPRVVFRGSFVGMYTDMNRGSSGKLARRPVEQLTIEPVRDLTRLEEFDDVHVSCGLPRGAFQNIFSQLPTRLLGEDSALQCFVGYLGAVRQPAVCGLLTLHACVAGLYYVLVSPQNRDIGLGDQMMAHMMELARAKGYRYATLVTDQGGQKVYEAQGFVSACSFRKYGSK